MSTSDYTREKLHALELLLKVEGFSLTRDIGTIGNFPAEVAYRISPGGMGYHDHKGIVNARGDAEAVAAIEAFLIGYLGQQALLEARFPHRSGEPGPWD